MSNVTLFTELTDPKSGYTKTLQSVLDAIKDPTARIKPKILELRGCNDKNQRETLKRSLPVVCFSGVFTERRASCLKDYSKIICLDFDEVECLEDLETDLRLNEFVLACWRSPSDAGVKALVRVSSDNHLGHALALLKDFPLADPNAIKDVCRATFLSWDTNLYHNPNSSIYDRLILPKCTPEQTYNNLKTWLSNKGNHFVSGNRNSFIVKLAAGGNRFGIDKEYLKTQIEFDFVMGSDFTRNEMTRTVDGIYNRYQSQFSTQSFENVSSTKQVDEIMNADEGEVNDIITVNDIQEDLVRDFEEGSPGGETTYYPELDKIFRFCRGEQTTLTGVSGAGKSIILTQLLVIKAAFEKKKFGILSMEQYPPTFFYKEIIRMIVGKPLERNALDRMTRAEFDLAMQWVHEHFYYIYPSSADPTPEWTLGEFYEAIIKFGVDGVVVDPYNSQSHDFRSAGGRDDRYISSMLRKNERFALQNNVYFFNVAHPKGIGKKEDGTYREPTADEISGGPAWWQCSSNILIHHRPTLPLDIHDTSCTLRSQKIKKQPANGKPGVANFNFDWRSGRFFDENHFNPLTKFKL